MHITHENTVGEIVKLNFRTAQLFQSNNIDFCCGGNKTISEACDEAGVNSGQLLEQLEAASQQADPDSMYINSLEPDELSDYIVKRHHSYVRTNIPFLMRNLEKLCDVHGGNHPELIDISELFNESVGGLTMHMQKEEDILFPFIRKMTRLQKENSVLDGASFGPVASPIGAMINEHETEGRRFQIIAELTGNYTAPPDACTTYQVTFNTLKDFEADLHRHIHLENNILFPKALEMEAALIK